MTDQAAETAEHDEAPLPQPTIARYPFAAHPPYTDAELIGGQDLGPEMRAFMVEARQAQAEVEALQTALDAALLRRRNVVRRLWDFGRGLTKYRIAKLLGLSQTSVTNMLMNDEERAERAR